MDATKLFKVHESSAEHVSVAALLLETLPRATVTRVDRIENGLLRRSFDLQASTIESQLGADYNAAKMRRKLFHGTKAVEAIVNSMDGHGFQPLLAGTAVGAIHGDGTYFARDARYSDNGYARTLPTGEKQVLVVDVVVGRWAKGAKGIKICPLLPGEQYVRYNSLVDNTRNPSIFVVQHSNQAYPAYLLTYRLK